MLGDYNCGRLRQEMRKKGGKDVGGHRRNDDEYAYAGGG